MNFLDNVVMELSSIYKRFVSKGVIENDYYHNKKIQLLNSYIFFWSILIIVFSMVDILTYYKFYDEKFHLERYRYNGLYTQLGTLLCFWLVYTVNKYHLFKWARIFFILTAIINFSLFAYVINTGRYLEYFFILLPILALTLFRKNLFPFIMVFVSFGLYLATYYAFDIYPKDYTKRILDTSMFCVFLAIYLLTNYFKKLNIENENLLRLEKDKVVSDKMILEQQELELRELSEFKSHFFINLSHEIRTPLTLIQGYTSQIDLKGELAVNQEKLNVITEQTHQMQAIINNIMDLSKMDSKEFTIHAKPFDVYDLLHYNYTNFKPLFEKKGIDFSLQTAQVKNTIQIDKELFDKVLNNLLSNALKFTSVKGMVVLKAIFIGEHLCIQVIDNGIGIPKHEIDLVFTRFYQVKNDITKSQGSGIGLAFTKSIVEAHGFAITLESEPGIITKFSIEIPKSSVSKLNKASIAINPESLSIDVVAQKESTSDRGKKPKILLVDDHEQMRVYLTKILVSYEVVEAEHGKHALEILKKDSFDLIVTDFMMPVMDGEALVKTLKKQHNKTPILVLTARTDQQGKLNMLRLGIDGYLHKPFLEEELLLQVKNAIRLYKNMTAFQDDLPVAEKKELDEYAEKFQKELIDYISENLTSPLLGVEDVAAFFKTSRSTLNRRTKSILGQTVNDLILEARLSHARKLRIEDPYLNKKQIAAEVGLSNTTYLFKKMGERYGQI